MQKVYDPPLFWIDIMHGQCRAWCCRHLGILVEILSKSSPFGRPETKRSKNKNLRLCLEVRIGIPVGSRSGRGMWQVLCESCYNCSYCGCHQRLPRQWDFWPSGSQCGGGLQGTCLGGRGQLLRHHLMSLLKCVIFSLHSSQITIWGSSSSWLVVVYASFARLIWRCSECLVL